MDQNHWKHAKSGGLYTILHTNGINEATMESVVVYRAVADGQVWVRNSAEFFDGRFVEVAMES